MCMHTLTSFKSEDVRSGHYDPGRVQRQALTTNGLVA